MQTTIERERSLPYAAERAERSRDAAVPWRPGHILVASRGSRTSDGALRVAAMLARRLGAEIELVTVFQPEVPAPTAPTMRRPCERCDRTRVAELLRCVRSQRLAVLGVSSHMPMRLVVGYPPAALADAAAETGAELIVLGLGRSDPEERVRGDETALRLAYAADVPVLVVPANARGPIAELVVLDEEPDGGERTQRIASSLLDAPAHTVGGSQGAEDAVRYVLALARGGAREAIALALHGRTFEERAVATQTADRVLRATDTAVLLVPPERSHAHEHGPSPGERARRGEVPTARVFQPGAVSRV